MLQHSLYSLPFMFARSFHIQCVARAGLRIVLNHSGHPLRRNQGHRSCEVIAGNSSQYYHQLKFYDLFLINIGIYCFLGNFHCFLLMNLQLLKGFKYSDSTNGDSPSKLITVIITTNTTAYSETYQLNLNIKLIDSTYFWSTSYRPEIY